MTYRLAAPEGAASCKSAAQWESWEHGICCILICKATQYCHHRHCSIDAHVSARCLVRDRNWLCTSFWSYPLPGSCLPAQNADACHAVCASITVALLLSHQQCLTAGPHSPRPSAVGLQPAYRSAARRAGCWSGLTAAPGSPERTWAATPVPTPDKPPLKG